MTLAGAIFGLIVFAVLAMTLGTARARGNLDAMFLATMLCGTWLAGKLISLDLGAWANVSLYPGSDAACALMVLWAYIERVERWKLAIIWALFCKELLHVWFWTGGGGEASSLLTRGVYMVALDVLFSVEIGCVALGAFSHGAGDLRRLLPRRGRGSAVALAARRAPPEVSTP